MLGDENRIMFWSLFVAKFFLYSLFFCKHKFYTLRHIKIIELLMGNVLSWWIYSVKYSYLGPIFAYLLPVAAGESQVILFVDIAFCFFRISCWWIYSDFHNKVTVLVSFSLFFWLEFTYFRATLRFKSNTLEFTFFC